MPAIIKSLPPVLPAVNGNRGFGFPIALSLETFITQESTCEILNQLTSGIDEVLLYTKDNQDLPLLVPCGQGAIIIREI